MSSVGILGSGAFAKEVFHWAIRAGLNPQHFLVTSSEFSSSITPVAGRSFVSDDVARDGFEYICGIANPKIKQVAITKKDIRLSAFVADPSAFVAPGCVIGPGSIICPGTIISADTAIGVMASINLNATVGHDCRIGDFFNIGPGACLLDNCQIGSMVSIGARAVVREGLYICDNVVIGMGSVVVKDIKEPGVYMGAPAKKVKSQY